MSRRRPAASRMRRDHSRRWMSNASVRAAMEWSIRGFEAHGGRGEVAEAQEPPRDVEDGPVVLAAPQHLEERVVGVNAVPRNVEDLVVAMRARKASLRRPPARRSRQWRCRRRGRRRRRAPRPRRAWTSRRSGIGSPRVAEPAAPVTSRMAASTSPGSSSSQPGRGLRRSYSRYADPRSVPSSRNATALTPVVPMSRPRDGHGGRVYP